MSNARSETSNAWEWPAVAEVLDALGTAALLADVPAYAEQYDKMQQLSKHKHSLAAAAYLPRLLTALSHAVSSGLLLVCQLSLRRVQLLSPAAADCFFCCIDTYCHLLDAGTKRQHLLPQLRTDIAESGQCPQQSCQLSKAYCVASSAAAVHVHLLRQIWEHSLQCCCSACGARTII